MNEKYPGGLEAQAVILQQEGHAIELNKKGEPKKVKDFEKSLVEV
ncbi:hypothetical protein ACFLTB_04540 [Chloroflexota bacterium]